MGDAISGTAEIWIRLDTPFARYEVSDLGRVRNIKTGHIMRPAAVGQYRRVTLRKETNHPSAQYVHRLVAHPSAQYVHRLVAQAFLGLPQNPDFEVHHINRSPSDNRADNLQWCSRLKNNRMKVIPPTRPGRPVIQTNMDSSFVKRYTKIKDIPYNHSYIIRACKGRIESAYGFKWAYAEEARKSREKWAILENFGIQVSSLGRIRLPSGKITYGGKNNTGYPVIHLRNEGKPKQHLVHRLVAMAFCDLPDGATYKNMVVDHLNGNKSDNRFWNLEWVKNNENIRRFNQNRPPIRDAYRRKIRAIPKNGSKPIEFVSVADAVKKLGVNRRSLEQVALGKRKSTGGFYFEYINTDETSRD